jgi:hypothetical protein
MSIAPREAKWEMRWTCWPGQSTLTQKVSLSPASRTSGSPHTGHSVGNVHAARPSGAEGEHRAADLGDDVTRPDHDGVAGADVLDARTWSSLCKVASDTGPRPRPPARASRTGSPCRSGRSTP